MLNGLGARMSSQSIQMHIQGDRMAAPLDIANLMSNIQRGIFSVRHLADAFAADAFTYPSYLCKSHIATENRPSPVVGPTSLPTKRNYMAVRILESCTNQRPANQFRM